MGEFPPFFLKTRWAPAPESAGGWLVPHKAPSINRVSRTLPACASGWRRDVFHLFRLPSSPPRGKRPGGKLWRNPPANGCTTFNLEGRRTFVSVEWLSVSQLSVERVEASFSGKSRGGSSPLRFPSIQRKINHSS